jgi:hypothetical protein
MLFVTGMAETAWPAHNWDHPRLLAPKKIPKRGI